jgi:hypothetical protein
MIFRVYNFESLRWYNFRGLGLGAIGVKKNWKCHLPSVENHMLECCYKLGSLRFKFFKVLEVKV